MTKPKAAAEKVPSIPQRVKALEETTHSLENEISDVAGNISAWAYDRFRRLWLALLVVAAIAVAGLVLGVAR